MRVRAGPSDGNSHAPRTEAATNTLRQRVIRFIIPAVMPQDVACALRMAPLPPEQIRAIDNGLASMGIQFHNQYATQTLGRREESCSCCTKVTCVR
jgi:hypothetical protein